MKYKKTLIYLFQFNIIRIIFFIIIKEISNECDRDTPIRLTTNNTCISSFSNDLFNSGECFIDNEIIEKQWLNNIILIKENNFRYVNFLVYQNGDLLFETNSYPCSSDRIFFGLKQNGRYYFKNENNEEVPTLKINTKTGEENNYESSNSFIILDNNKQYLLNLGRLGSHTEIYDLENESVYNELTQNLIGYNIFNMKGNLFNINNKNLYIYECIVKNSGVYSAIFIKFELSLNENKIVSSKKKEIIKSNVGSEIQSGFKTEENLIIFFYANSTSYDHYNILVLDYNLNELCHTKLEEHLYNRNFFFGCIHYQGEAGAFLYYKKFTISGSTIYYPYIFFRKYNKENGEFEDFFANNNYITLDKFIFNKDLINNDLIKLSNNKIVFFSTSDDSLILYIVVLNIIDLNYKKIRYYKIHSNNLYQYKVYKGIKTTIYNKYIVYGSSLCKDLSCGDYSGTKYTSLMIFGYPNGNDDNFNIIQYLFDNNIISVDKKIINLSDSKIENNIFGYIIYGVLIQNMIKPENLVFYKNNKIIVVGEKLNIEEKISFSLNNNNNELENFEARLEYSFLATESKYSEYERFPVEIETKYGNDNEEIFNKNKEIYIGKTIYYNFYLNQTLNKNCNNKGCALCLSSNPNICMVCKYNFSIINNEKVCQPYPCTNNQIINNQCSYEKISNEQAKEIYNELMNKIKDNSLNNTIIETENFIFQVSNVEEQKNNSKNISSINLGQCESILKNKTNDSLIILKVDAKNEDLTSTYVFFEIFNPNSSKKKSDLEDCKNIPIEIKVPKILDNNTLIYYTSLNELGYNLFDSEDSFFNDICSTYTSINGKDMLLSDRWEDIYISSNNQYYCQEKCKLISYDLLSEKALCNCFIEEEEDKDINAQLDNMDFSSKEIIERFSKSIKNSNFVVLKCYKLVFVLKKFLKNIGSIIITIIIIIYLILMIIYFFTGRKKILKFIKYIFDLKTQENINIKREKRPGSTTIKKNKEEKLTKKKKNPPKRKNIQAKTNNIINIKNSYSIYSSNISRNLSINNSLNRNSSLMKLRNNSFNKIKRLNLNKSKTFIKKKKNSISVPPIKNNLKIINDFELNNLNYHDALKLDKRTFWQYYISLLRRKQLILFSFVPNKDFNLMVIKISLFLLSFSGYFAINGFFFDDKTMHKIYKNKSKYNFIEQIIIIIYSSLITSLLNKLLRELSLSEKSILSIKKEKNLKKTLLKAKDVESYLIIKFIIFYLVGLALLLFYWFFISCFCAVYSNTAVILLKDTLFSFVLSMFYPFGINLLPGIFRFIPLRMNKINNKKRQCLYKFSKILALV